MTISPCTLSFHPYLELFDHHLCCLRKVPPQHRVSRVMSTMSSASAVSGPGLTDASAPDLVSEAECYGVPTRAETRLGDVLPRSWLNQTYQGLEENRLSLVRES